MQILYLDSVDSTQKYLKKLIKEEKISSSYAVVANSQTDGVGSRGNSWSGVRNNLFLSFAIPLKDLPKDLRLESASIYFSYILKETLAELNSSVWLKWPNDFYIGDKKIGGMITNLVEDSLVCGVGLNIADAPENFAKLDIEVNRDELINIYFINIEKKSLWKQVFSKYKIEFYKNQNFYTHDKNLIISLEDASLQGDGSIVINGERIYSRR
ncbi:biotin--[acetyl-CoA-carboxylase] ligase [Sulfurimonas sp.]|uniref:biotin--[acetyl-CoA-carboxylase] ligase n=1 Tax=Sulfurimonas sp. TaxID=2022749 RepID=UPI00286DFDF6|nr:biotin--[acetyl-CoA-carboxylase] ligase [Sulfurimonas sp.]